MWSGGQKVLPPTLVVRAVEYEVLPRDMAAAVGISPAEVKEHFADEADLAVIKCVCVDGNGVKLTCVAGARRFKEMLKTGEAGNPAGMRMTRSTWPFVFRGWRQAS
jgi:hypothetical protein